MRAYWLILLFLSSCVQSFPGSPAKPESLIALVLAGSATTYLTPADLPNARMWYRAETLESQYGNGIPIDNWTNSISSGTFLIANVGAARPLMDTTSGHFGGRGSAYFNNASSQSLTVAGGTLTAPAGCTMGVVLSRTTAGVLRPIFSLIATPTTDGRMLGFNPANQICWHDSQAAPAGLLFTGSFAASSGPWIIIYTGSGTTGSFYVNGSLALTNTIASGACPVAAPTSSVAMGTKNGGGNFFDGRIAELFYAESSVTATEAASLACYWKNKFSVTAASCQ